MNIELSVIIYKKKMITWIYSMLFTIQHWSMKMLLLPLGGKRVFEKNFFYSHRPKFE